MGHHATARRRRKKRQAAARQIKPLTPLQQLRETAINAAGLTKRQVAEKMSELMDDRDKRWRHRDALSETTVSALVRDKFYSERTAVAFCRVVGASKVILFPDGADGPRKARDNEGLYAEGAHPSHSV